MGRGGSYRPSANGAAQLHLPTPPSYQFVEGATIKRVQTHEEMLALVRLGQAHRTTSATAMNSYSSRSHSIFTIVLTQSASDIGGEGSGASGRSAIGGTVSKVNLIDLAGSESSKHSKTSGQGLKEGASINNSLLTLGRVIKVLAESGGRGQIRVPYR